MPEARDESGALTRSLSHPPSLTDEEIHMNLAFHIVRVISMMTMPPTEKMLGLEADALLQSLDLQASHRVLEIGSGCGYATAVLARIVSQVVALEVDADLATRTSRLLARLEVNNAQVTVGSLAAGEPTRAPYDRILFSGAVEEVPDAVKRQLAEGGRLAAVVRTNGVGKAVVVERHGEAFGVREVFDAAIPILPGLTRPKGFVF